MTIVPGDLDHPAVQDLLRLHFARMRANSPPEACHVLDLSGLQSPDITFVADWQGADLRAVGALKQLSPTHGEVKSMRTADAFLRQGAARNVLVHLIGLAQARGYTRLSLETGNSPDFLPALRLYHAHGFRTGDPFGGYQPTDFTEFLHRDL